jgi:RimJ/RimL family protein N-acetyltransferase
MITTARLSIRPFTEIDAPAFFDLARDEGFRQFPITDYRQRDVAAAQEWIRTHTTKWGVWHSSQLIGLGGLTPWDCDGEALVDMTYRLRESAWGQGFGLELARALVRHGFEELRLAQITATITPDNVASQRIAAKLGMVFDRRIILKGVPTEFYRLVAR